MKLSTKLLTFGFAILALALMVPFDDHSDYGFLTNFTVFLILTLASLAILITGAILKKREKARDEEAMKEPSDFDEPPAPENENHDLDEATEGLKGDAKEVTTWSKTKNSTSE